MQQSRLVSSFVGAVFLFLVAAVVVVSCVFSRNISVPVVHLQLLPHILATSYTSSNNVDIAVPVLSSDGLSHQQQLRSGSTTASSRSNNIDWHIKPIKPHHTGHVSYVTEISSDRNHLIYKRIFNAPCGYGMLVFNVGPAAVYEPYTYELYDDAYAYSNNEGLCVLYPSYNGIQESTAPLWSFNDELEMTVPLGDTPTQISTRIVIPPNTKPINTTDPTKYHGGDYLIIQDGNFYNPTYYKNLKELINHWPPTVMKEDIPNLLSELVATL